jgi:hypothetical protein
MARLIIAALLLMTVSAVGCATKTAKPQTVWGELEPEGPDQDPMPDDLPR